MRHLFAKNHAKIEERPNSWKNYISFNDIVFDENMQTQQTLISTFSNAQNFYLLKIHLNLFEISYRGLKFEKIIKIWKSFIPSENGFQTRTPLRSGAMCMYSSLSCDEVEYMHIVLLHFWNRFSEKIKKKSYSNFKFQSSIWDFK